MDGAGIRAAAATTKYDIATAAMKLMCAAEAMRPDLEARRRASQQLIEALEAALRQAAQVAPEIYSVEWKDGALVVGGAVVVRVGSEGIDVVHRPSWRGPLPKRPRLRFNPVLGIWEGYEPHGDSALDVVVETLTRMLLGMSTRGDTRRVDPHVPRVPAEPRVPWVPQTGQACTSQTNR